MRWQCLNCKRVLGQVIFSEDFTSMRNAYCPYCREMMLMEISDDLSEERVGAFREAKKSLRDHRNKALRGH